MDTCPENIGIQRSTESHGKVKNNTIIIFSFWSRFIHFKIKIWCLRYRLRYEFEKKLARINWISQRDDSDSKSFLLQLTFCNNIEGSIWTISYDGNRTYNENCHDKGSNIWIGKMQTKCPNNDKFSVFHKFQQFVNLKWFYFQTSDLDYLK